MLENIIYSLDWTQVTVALLTMSLSGLALWYRRRLLRWRAFWRGVLDGLRAIPSLEADVKGIRYFVAPNGGGSLADAVARTELAVGGLTEHVDILVETMGAEHDLDEEVGRFYCNAVGENTYVNKTYARWLGVGKPELIGWNYFNFVHPDDIDRVRRNWDACRAEHRMFHSRYRLVAADGEVIEVDATVTPIPSTAPAKRWVGFIRKANTDDRCCNSA